MKKGKHIVIEDDEDDSFMNKENDNHKNDFMEISESFIERSSERES